MAGFMPEDIRHGADGTTVRTALWIGYGMARIYVSCRQPDASWFADLGWYSYHRGIWRAKPMDGYAERFTQVMRAAYTSSDDLMRAMACVEDHGRWRPPTHEELQTRYRRLQSDATRALPSVEDMLDNPTPDADRLLRGFYE